MFSFDSVIVMRFKCEVERGIRREGKVVRIVCGSRSLLFFLTFDRVPEAVLDELRMNV